MDPVAFDTSNIQAQAACQMQVKVQKAATDDQGKRALSLVESATNLPSTRALHETGRLLDVVA